MHRVGTTRSYLVNRGVTAVLVIRLSTTITTPTTKTLEITNGAKKVTQHNRPSMKQLGQSYGTKINRFASVSSWK